MHIVGTPATSDQIDGKLLHHTLGDHKFDAFSQMARQITAAQLDFATLKREGRMIDASEQSGAAVVGEDAVRELDNILEVCVRKVRPVLPAARQLC